MPEHGIDVLHTDGLSDLADHIYTMARGALDSISGSDRDGIYVVSLFVYDEQDDPRLPTVTVGFNTESDVAASGDFSSDDEEARWSYAFYRQNQLALICDSTHDPSGAALREAWAKANGYWYELGENEKGSFNERGTPLTHAFVGILVDVVRRFHEGDIVRNFGKPIPVLIHELEYYVEIADQNLAANPAGLVDDFARFCRGG